MCWEIPHQQDIANINFALNLFYKMEIWTKLSLGHHVRFKNVDPYAWHDLLVRRWCDNKNIRSQRNQHNFHNSLTGVFVVAPKINNIRAHETSVKFDTKDLLNIQ